MFDKAFAIDKLKFDAAIFSGKKGPALLSLSITLVIGAVWYLVQHPVVAIAFGLLPFAAYFVLRWPYLVILFFVLFTFFRLHEVFPVIYTFRIPQLLAMGALASLAFNLMAGRIKPYWSREHTVFAVFFVHIMLGIIFATNRSVALEHFVDTFSKIAIMVLAFSWLATGKREMAIASRLIPFAGLAVGLVALWNKHHGIGLVEGTRVTIGLDIGSMLGDPNDLALVLLFPTSFALALLNTPKIGRGWKIFGLMTYAILFSAIVATQSRGGLLGILAVTGVYIQQRIRSKMLLAVIGLVGLLALFAMAGISDRASGGAHEEGLDESAKGRLYAWLAAIKMAALNPIFGVGMLCFYYNYYLYSDYWDGKNYTTHSTYFQVLSDTGIVGAIIFATLIILTMRLSRRLLANYKPATKEEINEQTYEPEYFVMSQAIWGGLVGFLVSGTFLSQAFTWPFYIILAFTLAAARIMNEKQASLENATTGEIR